MQSILKFYAATGGVKVMTQLMCCFQILLSGSLQNKSVDSHLPVATVVDFTTKLDRTFRLFVVKRFDIIH